MAKDQDLPVNPLQIAGACGRLMCCLKYEHPLYQEFQRRRPAVGASVDTAGGRTGTVVATTSRPTRSSSGSTTAAGAAPARKASVCGPRKAHDAAYGNEPAEQP